MAGIAPRAGAGGVTGWPSDHSSTLPRFRPAAGSRWEADLLDVGILGPTLVRTDGTEQGLGGPRRRALVARLALDANRGVLADRLVEDLWDGEPPPAAVATLHAHISAVRRVVGPGSLLTRPDGYVLLLAPGALDAERFERDVAAAQAAMDAGDPAAAVEGFESGLACWRGPALADAGGAAWAAGAVARFEERRLTAEEGRLGALLALGRHDAVVAGAEALIAEHPLRERLWAHLLVALYRSDRQADALRAYQRVRHQLNDQLGIDPGPELRRLEAAILAQDPDLGPPPVAPRPTSPPPSPARGDQEAPAGAVPLPPRLALDDGVPFVGRQAELDGLLDQLAAVGGGARRLVVIAGEPGIGKTRLAAETARAAHARGARVLYGRCDEDLGLPYQPYVEILEALRDQVGAALVREHLERRGGALARLLPTAGGAGHAQPARPTEGEDERYLLFGAVLDLLMAATEGRPVVLVLDDLQWADAPTVLLTRFLVTAPRAHHLLVLVTHRAGEVPADGPLAQFLDVARRDPTCARLGLEGLGRQELVALCTHALGGDEPAATRLGVEVWSRTDGNPFFALELVRFRAEGGPTAGAGRIPREVRDVIDVRVARLGETCRRVLAGAAVVGREFEIDVAAAAVDVAPDDVLEALERASAAALLTPVHAERFSFAHALVQEAMYESLSPARRARVHHRVAEALERLAPDPSARIGEIATHWSKALAADAPRAAEAAAQAGRRALAQLAPDEAARWFALALDALEALGPERDTTERLRGELLVDLGEAQRQVGDPAYRATLLEAARRARSRGDVPQLVRAALANNRGFASVTHTVDAERVEMIEAALAALAALDETDPIARARLLALLAVELLFAPDDGSRRLALSDEALALTRVHDDPVARLHVLNLRFSTVYDLVPGERDQATLEAVALADRLGEPVGRFWAHFARAVAAVTAGRADEVDEHTRLVAELAEHVGRPTLRWMAALNQGWVAALHGEADTAERHARRVLELGEETGQPDSLMFGHGLLAEVAWMRGRTTANVDQLTRARVPAAADRHMIAAPLTRVLLAAGKPERARALLLAAADAGFASVRRDTAYLPVLHLYGEAAATLAEGKAGEMVYRLLLPRRDEVAFHGFGVNGSTEHVLGLLALAAGRVAVADDHFARAEAVHRGLRAPFLLAGTLVAWGASLAARAGEARERGLTLLDEAAALARAGGFIAVERQARQRLEAASPASPAEPASPDDRGGGDQGSTSASPARPATMPP